MTDWVAVAEKAWVTKRVRYGPSGTSEAGRKRARGPDCHRWTGGRHVHHSGYVMVYVGEGKYRLEHRVVMEKHLGRILIRTEIVHHRNGIKADNRIENLELIGSSGEHLLERHDLKFDLDLSELLRLYEIPLSLEEVGKRMGVCHSTIKNRLVEMGKLRTRRKLRGCPIFADMDYIVDLWKQGYQLKEIAVKTGIKRATVWYKIKRWESLSEQEREMERSMFRDGMREETVKEREP